MRITSITPSAKRPGRFDVDIDARQVATLAVESIDRLQLAVGRGVDEALSARIEREAAFTATFDRAAAMLSFRARASADLRRQLIRKGEPADLVDAAIEKLRAVGFLDDAQYARQFARAKGAGAGLSRRRIGQELGRRGVSRAVADEAVDAVFDEEGIDEAASLERVAAKKLRTMSKLDDETQRRRLYAFLARRGYDSDAIRRVVEALVTR